MPRSPAGSTSSNSATGPRRPAGGARRAGRARGARQACARHGALLAVNDRADIALASGADVLHLGQDDLPVAWARKIVGDEVVVGRSAHSTAETAAAADEPGVDYFCAGPCWPTPTKPGRPAPGLDLVRTVAGRAPARPWFAIGGIDGERLDEVWRREPSGWSSSGRSPRRRTRVPPPPAGGAAAAVRRDPDGALGAPDAHRPVRSRSAPVTCYCARPPRRTRLRCRSGVALAALVALLAGAALGRRRRGPPRGGRLLLVRAEAPARLGRAAVPLASSSELSASLVGSADSVSSGAEVSDDVSVLALSERPTPSPRRAAGALRCRRAARVQRRALHQLDPVIASIPMTNTTTVNPAITSRRRRDFGGPASTAATAEISSVG